MTPLPPTWKWSELNLQDIQMLLAPCLLCFLGGAVGTTRGVIVLLSRVTSTGPYLQRIVGRTPRLVFLR